MSYAEFGPFNGLYLGVAGLMSVAGGVIADRRGRYKEVAGAGLAGVVGAVRRPRRQGCAPRDALISLSAELKRLGTAFGVHRAFDTAGAVFGPFVAFLVLRAAPSA